MIRNLLLAATLFTARLLAQQTAAVPEHLSNGSLTAQNPRLTWTLRAAPNAGRGIRQTAYQIRVATTRPRCCSQIDPTYGIQARCSPQP